MQDIRGFIAFEQWLEGVIAAETNVRRERINPATAINNDIGVDGDDAYELLVLVQDKTGADFSDFPYDDYFGAESQGYEMVQAIRRLFRREKKTWRRLTVRDLALYMWKHGGRIPAPAVTTGQI